MDPDQIQSDTTDSAQPMNGLNTTPAHVPSDQKLDGPDVPNAVRTQPQDVNMSTEGSDSQS